MTRFEPNVECMLSGLDLLAEQFPVFAGYVTSCFMVCRWRKLAAATAGMYTNNTHPPLKSFAVIVAVVLPRER